MRECISVNPTHITTKFHTVVIVREGFEINMFEDVTHFSSGPPQPLSSLTLQSVCHTKIVSDEVTGYLSTNTTIAIIKDRSWLRLV